MHECWRQSYSSPQCGRSDNKTMKFDDKIERENRLKNDFQSATRKLRRNFEEIKSEDKTWWSLGPPRQFTAPRQCRTDETYAVCIYRRFRVPKKHCVSVRTGLGKMCTFSSQCMVATKWRTRMRLIKRQRNLALRILAPKPLASRIPCCLSANQTLRTSRNLMSSPGVAYSWMRHAKYRYRYRGPQVLMRTCVEKLEIMHCQQPRPLISLRGASAACWPHRGHCPRFSCMPSSRMPNHPSGRSSHQAYLHSYSAEWLLVVSGLRRRMVRLRPETKEAWMRRSLLPHYISDYDHQSHLLLEP